MVTDHRVNNSLFSQPQNCTLAQVARICAGGPVRYSPSMRAGATGPISEARDFGDEVPVTAYN